MGERHLLVVSTATVEMSRFGHQGFHSFRNVFERALDERISNGLGLATTTPSFLLIRRGARRGFFRFSDRQLVQFAIPNLQGECIQEEASQ